MKYTFEHAIKAITEMCCWSWMLDTTSCGLLSVFNKRHQSCPAHIKWVKQTDRCAMKPRRQIRNECCSYLSADFRCRLIVWIRLKIFRLIKLHASSFQLTFMPRSNLLHYLKGHCFHWKHSMTNMMIQYSHAGICGALFSISFLSERWISLSFRLTFCCLLGVSRRKLHIPFKGLIVMNVSNEQYSDVSCFRKRETRVLLIAWVHAYWEETKLNSWQSSSVGGHLRLSLSGLTELCVEYWTLYVFYSCIIYYWSIVLCVGILPKHCDKDGWLLFRKYSCSVPNTHKSDSWDVFICKNQLHCCILEQHALLLLLWFLHICFL